MSGAQCILALHGITMSGASMLRTLGPLGRGLEARGFTLFAPTAPHRMSDAEVTDLMNWLRPLYRKSGESADESYTAGKFWDAGEHYDWFQSNTDKQSGKKTYHALEQSLASLAAAIRERPVVGMIGFSQGAAMAMVLAGLVAHGDARFSSIRFGLFLSGFKPMFDVPRLDLYPAGTLPHAIVVGERDPIFPGDSNFLAAQAQAFAGGEEELVLVPGIGHDVPSSPELVERLVNFAARAAEHVRTPPHGNRG
jgi:pimeloyl-ACP methyl ester carboxylesterase